MQKSLFNKNYDFNLVNWEAEEDSNIIVLAIHGYNDYSNAFEIPGSYLSNNKKFNYINIYCNFIYKIINFAQFFYNIYFITIE